MAKKWLSDAYLMEEASKRLLAGNQPFQIDAETRDLAERLLARSRDLGEELDSRMSARGEQDDVECPECEYPFNTFDSNDIPDEPGMLSCGFCGNEFMDPEYNTDDDEDVDDEEDK